MANKLFTRFIPPIIFDLKRKLQSKGTVGKQTTGLDILWQGDFQTWSDAYQQSTGYDASVILEKTLEAVLKVKNGEAVYERDSVIFDRPEYSWPLLAILLRIATENNNRLNILDFGGSLGSSYYQNKQFLNSLDQITWSVVEQEHYITVGNEKVADENLKFYFTIEDCIRERRPTTLLLSGVIQCVDSPYDWLNKFKKQDFEYIVFDRTAFINDDRDRLTVQKVPSSIYEASYPAWFFKKENIINALADKYEFIIDFNNGFTPDVDLAGKRGYWNGLFFKRKSK